MYIFLSWFEMCPKVSSNLRTSLFCYLEKLILYGMGQFFIVPFRLKSFSNIVTILVFNGMSRFYFGTFQPTTILKYNSNSVSTYEDWGTTEPAGKQKKKLGFTPGDRTPSNPWRKAAKRWGPKWGSHTGVYKREELSAPSRNARMTSNLNTRRIPSKLFGGICSSIVRCL